MNITWKRTEEEMIEREAELEVALAAATRALGVLMVTVDEAREYLDLSGDCYAAEHIAKTIEQVNQLLIQPTQ